MRLISVATIGSLWCISAALAADDGAQRPQLDLANLKVGDVGVLPPALDAARIRPSCESRIEWKIADHYFALEVQCYDVVQSVGENGLPAPPALQKAGRYHVVITGVSIANRNEGEKFHVAGSLKVTGIAKVKSGITPIVYVLEPAGPPPANKP